MCGAVGGRSGRVGVPRPPNETKVCAPFRAFWFCVVLAKNRNDFCSHCKMSIFLPKNLITLNPAQCFLPSLDVQLCLYGYYTLFGRLTCLEKFIFAVLRVVMSSSKTKPIAAFTNSRRQVLSKLTKCSAPTVWMLDGQRTNSIEAKVPHMRFDVCVASFFHLSVNV